MARQVINVGTTANDGTGDNLRVSQIKANANFAELYELVGTGGAGGLPLAYGQLKILAKGIQGGVPNISTDLEINDLVFGRWSPVLFIKYAVFSGGDVEDINNYNILETVDVPE